MSVKESPWPLVLPRRRLPAFKDGNDAYEAMRLSLLKARAGKYDIVADAICNSLAGVNLKELPQSISDDGEPQINQDIAAIAGLRDAARNLRAQAQALMDNERS